jgi:hypothetical protein
MVLLELSSYPDQYSGEAPLSEIFESKSCVSIHDKNMEVYEIVELIRALEFSFARVSQREESSL